MLYRPRQLQSTRRRGFTLIEASITTVIIGVGCVSMLALLGAGTTANNESAELTTAINLAGNVREAMAGIRFASKTEPTHWGPESGETLATFDDIDDFDGWSSTTSPIEGARRRQLGDAYKNWRQVVKVDSVRPDHLVMPMAHLTMPPELRPTSRVTVTVQRHGADVYSQSWIVTYADP